MAERWIEGLVIVWGRGEWTTNYGLPWVANEMTSQGAPDDPVSPPNV